jgi:hypothetical protein
LSASAAKIFFLVNFFEAKWRQRMVVNRAWVERNIGVDPTTVPIPPSTFAVRAAASPDASLDDLQREIIDFDSQGPEGAAFLAFTKATGLSRFVDIPWPKGLAPTPATRAPAGGAKPLPRAEVLVVTWTVDEGHALSRVLTPGKDSTNDYTPYTHNYAALSKQMSKGSPAVEAKRLGTFWTTTIGAAWRPSRSAPAPRTGLRSATSPTPRSPRKAP